MKSIFKTFFFLSAIYASAGSCSLNAQPINTNPQNETKTQSNMKEYILLIRLSTTYTPDQVKVAKETWNKILQKWKADGTYVISFVFPSESYVLSGSERSMVKESVVANNLRVVSSIILLASTLEEAVEIAKVCPILDQGGTVEVREVQPRPVATRN